MTRGVGGPRFFTPAVNLDAAQKARPEAEKALGAGKASEAAEAKAQQAVVKIQKAAAETRCSLGASVSCTIQ